MKQTRLLFIDRDGTLIQEPEDEQIDSFENWYSPRACSAISPSLPSTPTTSW